MDYRCWLRNSKFLSWLIMGLPLLTSIFVELITMTVLVTDPDFNFLNWIGNHVQAHKKSTNPNFWVRIFSGGVGVFHVKGWGPKSSIWPSKPGKSNFFWRDIPGFCRDIPGVPEKFEKKNLYLANGRGRFGGQIAGGDPKAFSRLQQPLFAVPALRELESACRVSIVWDAVTVPTVCFSGFSEGLLGGQQQFATQTLRVHLLGLEKVWVHFSAPTTCCCRRYLIQFVKVWFPRSCLFQASIWLQFPVSGELGSQPYSQESSYDPNLLLGSIHAYHCSIWRLFAK